MRNKHFFGWIGLRCMGKIRWRSGESVKKWMADGRVQAGYVEWIQFGRFPLFLRAV